MRSCAVSILRFLLRHGDREAPPPSRAQPSAGAAPEIGIYLPDRFRQPVVVQATELSGGGIGRAVLWCGKGIAHYLARFAHVHVLYKQPEIPANAANPEFAVSVT